VSLKADPEGSEPNPDMQDRPCRDERTHGFGRRDATRGRPFRRGSRL